MTTTLLAVENSQTLRKVLEITFAAVNVNLTLVSSGTEAMNAISTLPVNIALVDVTLEDVNGYDLCQQLKAQSPNTSVLILSSKQQPYDAARGGQVGADDFMDKPFDSQQLIDKVTALASRAPAPAGRPAAPAAAPARPAPAAAPPKPSRPAPQAPPQPVASRPPAMPTQRAPEARAAAPAAPPTAPPTAANTAPTASPVGASTVAAASGQLADKLQGLWLSQAPMEGVLALSREVLEQVVWEVVPVLAETMIKEEIARVTAG